MCELMRSSPSPDPEDIETLAANGEFIIARLDTSGYLREYLQDHRYRLATDLHLVRTMSPKPRQILEIGAYPYFLTKSIADLGVDVTTIDKVLNDADVDTLQPLGIRPRRCDIEVDRLPFESDTFDLVLCNEVFEHLRINPIFTLREVLRVLRPGGRLMLCTPNVLSARGWYNIIFRQRLYSDTGGVYETFSPLYKSESRFVGHVREYTMQELVDFTRKCGFDVLSAFYRGTFVTRRRLGRLANSLLRFNASLRPNFTIVCAKPAEAA